MKPIPFEGANKTLVGPEGSDIMPLPSYNDGVSTISCWQFTPEEIDIFIKNGGKMWVSVWAGCTSPPISIFPQTPTFPHPDAHSWIGYMPCISHTKGEFMQILNVTTTEAPPTIEVNERKWVRMTDIPPVRFKQSERFKSSDYYLRPANEVEQSIHHSTRVLCRVNTIDTSDGSPKDEQVFAYRS